MVKSTMKKGKPVNPKGSVKSQPKKRKNSPVAASKHQSSPPTKVPKNSAASESSEKTWSKSKKKRMRMLMGKEKKKEEAPMSSSNEKLSIPTIPGVEDTKTPNNNINSTLQSAFKARLSGSRFRILNEELYTSTSEESFGRFTQNPELFEQYHEGFRHQVESWPVNPVDIIVRWLSSQYQQSQCTVADFGCGDAQLAKDLLNIKHKGKTPFTVHSFDLVSPNALVTACDMANVPIKNKSVDVCVFCLSLMGTNLADFIREAHRVLKDNGKVKIAEVRSRIEYSHSKPSSSSNGNEKDATRKAGTLSEFVEVLNELGFKCTKKDLSNKMFLLLELEKTGKSPNKKLSFSAKPCIYKRR